MYTFRFLSCSFLLIFIALYKYYILLPTTNTKKQNLNDKTVREVSTTVRNSFPGDPKFTGYFFFQFTGQFYVGASPTTKLVGDR